MQDLSQKVIFYSLTLFLIFNIIIKDTQMQIHVCKTTLKTTNTDVRQAYVLQYRIRNTFEFSSRRNKHGP